MHLRTIHSTLCVLFIAVLTSTTTIRTHIQCTVTDQALGSAALLHHCNTVHLGALLLVAH